MVQVNISSQVLFQIILSCVDFAFYFLFGAVILMGSLLDNPATQIALCFSSILGIIETSIGEIKRNKLKIKRNSSQQQQQQVPLQTIYTIPSAQSSTYFSKQQEIIEVEVPSAQDSTSNLEDRYSQNFFVDRSSSTTTNPRYSNPFSNNNAIEQIQQQQQQQRQPSPTESAANQNLLYHTTRNSSERKRATASNVLIFSILLIVLNYISIPFNVFLSYLGKPTVEIISYSILQSGDGYSQDFFNQIGKDYYDVNGNYTNADSFDESKIYVPFEAYNDTMKRSLLGSVFYSSGNISCGVTDNIDSLVVNSGVSTGVFIQESAFFPSIKCYKALVVVNNTQYRSAMTYSVNKTGLTNNQRVYPKENLNDTMIVGDNMTMFVLDQSISRMVASTLYYDKFDYETFTYSKENQTGEYFEDFINERVYTDGYDHEINSTNNTARFQDLDNSFYYSTMKTVGYAFDRAIGHFGEEIPFIFVFTMKGDDNNSTNAQKYVRTTVSYTNKSSTQGQIMLGKFYYRIRTTQYKVNINNNNNNNQLLYNARPETRFENFTTLPDNVPINTTHDVIFFQPIHNQKVFPVVSGTLRNFANYSLMEGNDIEFYKTGDLVYDVAPILFIIAGILGAAIVLYFIAWVVTRKPSSVPLYYDLLHEHFQNGSDCKESIFSISRPLYVVTETDESSNMTWKGIK